MGPLQTMVALAIVVALVTPARAANICATQARKAAKLKSLIECVDGTDSKLDADFLRGFSPDDILRKLAAAIYRQVETTPLDPNTCDTIFVGCRGDNDVLLGCGGDAQRVVASDSTKLVVVGAKPLPNSNYCQVNGCNLANVIITLEGTATCLAVP